jgi:hypothetical protein
MKIILVLLSMIIISYTIYAQIVKEKQVSGIINMDRNKLVGLKFPAIKVETLSK